jgi:hypothetical protein
MYRAYSGPAQEQEGEKYVGRCEGREDRKEGECDVRESVTSTYLTFWSSWRSAI